MITNSGRLPISLYCRCLGTNLGEAQYLPLADHILILSDSKIRLQGSWDELQLNVKQIDKFMLDEPDCRDVSQVAEGQGGANAQKESRVDAARDLTRQSGDLRLYGKDGHV